MILRTLLLSVALGALCAAPVAAATINYGDCDDLGGGGTVTYEQVTESNTEPGPLYNAPACVGDVIDFDPTGFEARDDVNGNVSADTIEGMLDFAIQADTNRILDIISLNEGGDQQVFGFGISATAMATMTVDLSIIISDGGGGSLAVAYQDVQSVTFSLPADNNSTLQQWSLSADYILADILLDACTGQGQYAGNAVPEACGATTDRVGVMIDNLLSAYADDSGLAFINKKEAESLSLTTQTSNVPEPTTAALLGLGLAGIALRRRSG